MIEVKRSIGRRQGKGGVEVVGHPVDNIYRNGRLVGCVGRGKSPAINLFAPGWSREVKQEVFDAVKQHRQAEGEYDLPSGAFTSPPSLPTELLDIEETQESSAIILPEGYEDE